MGWVCEEDGRHEGFLVAVTPIPNSVEWRELGRADVDQAAGVVQVACACGWRSGRLFAPFGTRFGGGLVDVPLGHPPTPMYPRGQDHAFEIAAIRVWQAHTRELAELGAVLMLADR